MTVGGVKRVPQSGRTGWDAVRSSPRIGQRFPNAIEGKGNSSSKVVQQGGRTRAWMRNWSRDGN